MSSHKTRIWLALAVAHMCVTCPALAELANPSDPVDALLLKQAKEVNKDLPHKDGSGAEMNGMAVGHHQVVYLYTTAAGTSVPPDAASVSKQMTSDACKNPSTKRLMELGVRIVLVYQNPERQLVHVQTNSPGDCK